MKFEEKGKLLRIFVGESDKWKHTPLYEAIVKLARKHNLAGATVLRGIEGFGAHSCLHTAKVLRLSEDLPIVIELVDEKEKIMHFLPLLDDMVYQGLITLESIDIIKYAPKKE